MVTERRDPETQSLVKQAIAEGAGQPAGFTLWDLTDDGLIRVRAQYRLELELGTARYPRRAIEAWLADIRWIRLVRWCLRMRYGAVDEHLGTKSWDRHNRFGEAPAYSFALELDKLRWSFRDHPRMPRRGTRRHILNWDQLGVEPHWIATWGCAPAHDPGR